MKPGASVLARRILNGSGLLRAGGVIDWAALPVLAERYDLGCELPVVRHSSGPRISVSRRAASWIERRIEAVAKRIREYAGRDPELRRVVAELEAERPIFAAAMPAMELKSRFFASATASATMSRGRDQYGRAQR